MKIWIATQEEDSQCYNLIGKSKESVLRQIEDEDSCLHYEELYYVEIPKMTAFEMFAYFTGEGGGRSPYCYNVLATYKRAKDGVFNKIK